MANLKKVIYINEEDYSTLINGDSLVIDGTTYTYEENALYVIKNVGPPEYAETAGYATNAGTSLVAVTDASGNNIAATYGKKPLIIEVEDGDTEVPSGTFDSITGALNNGSRVIIKFISGDEYNTDIYYLPLTLYILCYTFEALIYKKYIWIEIDKYNNVSINNYNVSDDTNVIHLNTTETITGDKTFTGTVSLGSNTTATTPATTDNDTSVATTAFVHNVIDAIPEITTGQIVGRMYRDNVSGTGNLTITGASGEGFNPNGITTAGKYIVVVYSWSDTKTFGYNISFGSNSYTLSTTDGTISDKRELTVSAGALWSGSVTTAVSAGTTIIVEIYKAEKITPALSVGTVALTNLYNDLDGKPTISSSTSSTSTTDIASSKAVKLAYDHGGVQSVNGLTGAVSLSLGDTNIIESISVNGVALTITNKNVDIVISGGGSGDTNVIETVKVNGTALTPDANKAVNIPIDVVVVNWYDKFAGNADFNMIDGDTGSLTTNEISELTSLIDTNDKYVIIRGATPSGEYIYYKFAYDTGEYWDFVSHALAAKYTLRVDYGRNNTWTFRRRVEGIINGVKVNGTELTLDNSNKVDISVPTKTSDLTNDSNFTTLSEVTLTIVNSAPATLDTLNELAAALGNDANFATTVATQIGEKYTKPSTGIPASDLAAGVIPTVPVQSVNGQTGAVTVKANVQSDWNATTGDAVILNKPTIPDEKLSSSYQISTLENDNLLLARGDTYETAFSKIEKAILDNEETIAASLNDLNTRKIEIDDVPTKTSDLTNDSGFLTSYTETDPTVQSWAKNNIYFATGQNALNALGFNSRHFIKSNDYSTGIFVQLANDAGQYIDYIVTSADPQGAIAHGERTRQIPTLDYLNSTYYKKLSTGIPKTDLASAVQTSLGLADTALLSHQSIKTLNTNNTTTQTADASETIAGSGTINLHKIAKTGSYNDLLDKPTIPAAVTESTVSGWGFTKNAGTITGITMNGASKGTSGVVDLGTVLTSHQTLKTINSESIVGSGNLTISGLPTVSASDNGKILLVVNGAWALVTPVTVYTGTSTPNSSLGSNGDLYVLTS